MITPEMLARNGSEDSHQTALYCWRALTVGTMPELKWLHAIPNGGYRDPKTAGKLKATGVRRGIWDNFLPVPTEDWSGLYIELKVGKNKLTVEQEEFRNDLRHWYQFKVCYGWEDARDRVVEYLKQ